MPDLRADATLDPPAERRRGLFGCAGVGTGPQLPTSEVKGEPVNHRAVRELLICRALWDILGEHRGSYGRPPGL